MLDLDQDPVPGDPYEVKDLAKTLTGFAEDVGTALRSLRGLSGDSALLDWVGLSGDEFRKQYGDLPKELDKLETSYRMAGSALAAYWPQLEQAQAKADKALQDGRDARAQLSAANTHLSSANGWVTRANAESQKYQQNPQSNTPPPNPADVRAAARNATDAQQARQAAQSAVSSAQDKLAAAKAMAADAAHLRDHAADTCAKSLDDASHAGIQNKHWWQKAVDFVVDHWDDIVAVCKVIVAVLGIVVLIIGGPLAWVLVAAAAVVLTDTLIKYAQGKASLWDVGFAALSCIPMTEGLTSLGGLAQLAKDAPELLRSGDALANMASALRGGGEAIEDTSTTLREGAEDEAAVSKAMEGRCKGGDPIDMISGEMLKSETDVVLPGLLPLALRRAHVSSYRSGSWFGRSWASTLDQRLEADGDGIVFAAEDGMILVYPVPQPGVPVSPSHGPRWPLEWDGTPGAEIRITDPTTGHTRHFTPLADEPPGGPFTLPLAAITDRNGHRIEFDRTDEGVPTAVRHSGGYRVAVDTEGSRVTALRLLGTGEEGSDAGTLLRSYGYDYAGNLTEITDTSGEARRLTYDDRHRITSWTDRNGYWYRYEYDGTSARVVRGVGRDGYLSATFEYELERRVTTMTNSLGHRTAYHYDEHYHLTRTVDPHGGAVLTEHDHYGRLLSRTDELGHTARFTLDEHGNLLRMDRPDGTTVRVAYNELSLPVRVTEPNGEVWQYAYDECGNLLATTDPLGATASFTYDERGRRIAHTDALGNRLLFETDGAGLVVRATDPLGRTARMQRDAFGRVVTIEDAVGGVVRQGWTGEGQLAWRVAADGSREEWRHDREGNLTEHRDAAGLSTVYEYGAFDLPRLRIDPDGARYEFTHDSELRLIAVTNPQGLVWRYVFDETGCLTSETDFDGHTLAYVSDATGRLVERANGAGQTVRLTRDSRGRVVETRSDDGTVTTLDYDPAGRLIRAARPDGILEYTYDRVGRVLSESVDGRTVLSEYDQLGRRVRRITPTGAVSRWTYDASGLPATLSTAGGDLTFQYDQAGRETMRLLGAGAALTQSWDSAHRLIEQAIWATRTIPGTADDQRDRQQLQARAYTYRPDGHPTEIADQLRGTRHFDLDPAGRVTAVHAAHWTESYAYDALGNLTDASYPAVGDDDSQGPREYAGTLVRRAGRNSYQYDGQGRMVRTVRRTLSGQRREWQYAWDAEDRLTQVVTPDGTVWRYRYDALGRRIAKLRLDEQGDAAETTLFAWDAANLAEQTAPHPATGTTKAITWDWEPGTHRAATQLNRSWQTGGGEPRDGEPGTDNDEQAEFDRRFYAIVTDLLGTPSELVTLDGRIVWRGSTSLWGRPLDTGDQEAYCPLRFPGQYHDAETGLDYNFARYYDAELAAFLSPDPLGLKPAPNHRAYVDNPLSWSDPLGLTDESKITRIYDDSEYTKHGSGASSSAKGEIGRAPANGQAALDRSIPRNPDNPDSFRRIGVDYEHQEIVVLDRHRLIENPDGSVKEIYHGHVQSSYPSDAVQEKHLRQMKKAGMIDNVKKQRVLPPPCDK